jgi:hypothetical protein
LGDDAAMNLIAWAQRWGIPYAALDDFHKQIGALYNSVAPVLDVTPGVEEERVSNRVRLEGTQKGIYLWRNQVGAGTLENGAFIRWGLANDSPRVNKIFKSSDLIGIKKRLILAQDVGTYIGQFYAREIKKEGWHYSGSEREIAQLNFNELILANGGDAAFATGVGTL